MAIVNITSLSLTPGMYLDLKIPAITEANNFPNGLFPEARPVTVGGKKVTPIRGFVAENTDVGHIEKAESDGITARYVHDKPHPNRILFFPLNDVDIYAVSIIAVPIHDHSSLSQGGPAYGTYFTDYIPAEGEDNG